MGVSIAQILFAFGGMCAFCVIIGEYIHILCKSLSVGDTIPHVFSAILPTQYAFFRFLCNRRVVVILCTVFVSFPLSLYRDITKLAKASALALVSMVVIITTVVVKGPSVPEEYRGTNLYLFPQDFGFLKAIGVISFAFVCHHNSLLIYGALKKPTLDRFARVTHVSTGISLVACMIMALSGFIIFKDKTAGNILNNFPKDDLLVNIARYVILVPFL